jgi:hypothetical protein
MVTLGGEAPMSKKTISVEEYEKSLGSKPTVADYARQKRQKEDQQMAEAIEEAKRKIAQAEEEMGFEPH